MTLPFDYRESHLPLQPRSVLLCIVAERAEFGFSWGCAYFESPVNETCILRDLGSDMVLNRQGEKKTTTISCYDTFNSYARLLHLFSLCPPSFPYLFLEKADMRPYFTGFQSDRESVDPPNIISHLLVVQPEEGGWKRGGEEKRGGMGS